MRLYKWVAGWVADEVERHGFNRGPEYRKPDNDWPCPPGLDDCVCASDHPTRWADDVRFSGDVPEDKLDQSWKKPNHPEGGMSTWYLPAPLATEYLTTRRSRQEVFAEL
jgi:hypothetical protein